MRGFQNYFFEHKKIINIYLSLFITLLIWCSSLHTFYSFNKGNDRFLGTVNGSRAYDFEIEFSVSDFVVSPNTETFIDLFLVNTGDTDDTYTLTFTSIPDGWTAKFYNKGVFKDVLTLDVGTIEYPNIDVYITAPKSGGGILIVSCSSQYGQEIRTAQVSVDAKYIITFNLLDKSHEHSVYAGESTSFTIEVKNHQDIQDEISFTFNGKEIKIQNFADDVAWAVSFDNTSIILASDESKTVSLTVFAPKSGEPGNQININAIAKSESIDQEFEFPELIVRIPKIYNVTYIIKQLTPSSLAFPNSTVNYTLKLFNFGNVDLIITLRLLDNAENWEVNFFVDDKLKTPENLEIKIGKMIELRIQVKIPMTAKSGSHNVVYGVSRKELPESPLTKVNIITNVSLVSDLDIVLPQDVIPVELGKTTITTLSVSNKGNGKDILNISIIKISIPIGWSIYFNSIKNVKDEINTTEMVDFNGPIKMSYYEPTEYEPTINSEYDKVELVMDANKKAHIQLAIKTPNTGLPSTETIQIYGVSESGTIASVTKYLGLNLIVSDLKISDINVTPTNPLPGDNVNVKVEVTNNFHLPANDFTVRISRFTLTEKVGTELDSKQIDSLAAGSSTTVEFSWTDPEDIGDSYILEVTLTGNIIQNNNKPNKRETVIIGEPKEVKDGGDNLGSIILFLVLAIIIAIIVFLIIWLIISRRAPLDNDQQDVQTSKGMGKDPGKQRVKPALHSKKESDKFKYKSGSGKPPKDINTKPKKQEQIENLKSKSNKGRIN